MGKLIRGGEKLSVRGKGSGDASNYERLGFCVSVGVKMFSKEKRYISSGALVMICIPRVWSSPSSQHYQLYSASNTENVELDY